MPRKPKRTPDAATGQVVLTGAFLKTVDHLPGPERRALTRLHVRGQLLALPARPKTTDKEK